MYSFLFATLVLVAVAACGGSAAPESGETPVATSVPPSPTSAKPSVSPVTTQTPSPSPSPTPTTLAPAKTALPVLTATPVPASFEPIGSGDERRGGTLNLASRERIAHFDVHQELSPALSTWGPGIAYSRLMRLESGPGLESPSLRLECDLCESWTMEDETTFVFKLRNGVRWQDIQPVNGRELSSGDILFSYERQGEQGRPNAGLLAAIRQMDAPGPDTVRIAIVAPDADFLLSLADGHSKIVAREAVALRGDLRQGPTIGTGPWILIGTDVDGSHTFESNPDYFERGLPFVDRLAFNVIADPETRQSAFIVKAIDIQQMAPAVWSELRWQRPDVQFLLARGVGTGLEVALKTSAPPFDDVRIRRAVFQAMDPWKAIESAWFGAAYVSVGFPPREASWLLEESELRGFFGSPRLARDLLRDSGAGLPVRVTIKVGDFGEPYIQHARRIADEMREVGFEPALEVVTRREFGEDVWLDGNYRMFVGPMPPVTSPNGYMAQVLHSQGRWNTADYRDSGLDSMIEAQAREFDDAKRKDLVMGIQRQVLDNAYRFMPATQTGIWAWWPRVRDFHPNFAGFEYAHWARVWLAE